MIFQEQAAALSLRDSKTTKITRALARSQSDTGPSDGMIILHDSKITRALARSQSDTPGGVA